VKVCIGVRENGCVREKLWERKSVRKKRKSVWGRKRVRKKKCVGVRENSVCERKKCVREKE